MNHFASSLIPAKCQLFGYLLLACLLTEGADAESIVLTPPRRVGEAIDIEMTMTRERNDVGRPATKDSGTTPVRVEVLDVADKQTVIGWKLGRAKVEAPDEQVKKDLDPLLDLFAGQTIELVFDEQFTAHAIRNLDQIIQLSQRTIAALEKTLPKDQAAVVIPRVRKMFADPNTVQTVMLQKPGTYFNVYGWELDVGEPRKEEMALPSPFGGGPLPAMVTVELKPFKPTDTHYVVSYKQDLDPQGVERAIRAWVQQVAPEKYAPGAPLPKFDVRDTGEFKINKSTGWVEHAVFKRTRTHDEGSQIETYEFRKAR
jgi:hypothetical protein